MPVGWGCQIVWEGIMSRSAKYRRRVAAFNRRQKIREERDATYGGIKLVNDNLGKIWTAIIQQHYKIELPNEIPGYVVSMMMASMKILRASMPNAVILDCFDDAQNYLEIAQEDYEEEHEGSTS